MEETRLARRSVARAVIVEAGRRLAARDGISNLSLSAVAVEAGFNPSTVFGHFRNKDELVLAIIAEDLATMAALMRESSAANTFVEAMPPAVDIHTEAAEPNVSSPSVDREQTVLASEPVDGLAEPHAPRVDAWLERRLRIFEHMLGDLEQRLKQAEAEATRALAFSEDGMKNLFDRMETFERHQNETAQSQAGRIEETERRQRGATAEMRAAVNDAATRIEILEAARRTEAERASAQRERDARERSQSPENATLTVPTLPEQETYHAAAQRAADAAAALVELEEAPAETSGWRRLADTRVRVTKKHYTMAVCAAVIAFVLGAFVAFYAGEARGRELAAAIAGTRHMAVHPAGTARVAVKRPLHNSASLPADPRVRLATLAQTGNPHAELLMGLDLMRGNGIAPDQSKAAEWIRRAAEQHDPVAQYYLGALYEHGDGVAPDAAEALRWYEAAAGQGNRKAMHALGVAYAQGVGTQKDYSAAARWFTKAAELGLVNSEFNLGVLYERGLGVHQSLLDAFKWYAVAAAQGDQESRKRIDALKTQLSADDASAAQAAAANFRPEDLDREANNVPPLTALMNHSASR